MERDGKEKVIKECRDQLHASSQLQRDFDLQQSLYEKLQQQLVDEKTKVCYGSIKYINWNW